MECAEGVEFGVERPFMTDFIRSREESRRIETNIDMSQLNIEYFQKRLEEKMISVEKR